MTTPLLEVARLRKSHGAEFTLDIDSLTIARGETLSLLGPTGSGKSTLLRIVAGLDGQYEGDVRFGGVARSGKDLTLADLRRLALVHQRPLLLARTVRKNVEYGLKLRGKQNDAQVNDMLARCGLTSFAEQAAKTLSGGQMQLVALARALVIEPELLLLDEPTANLDPAHVEVVERLVSDYQQRSEATVIWATHNLFQAQRVAQRAALLLAGRLVEMADRETFFNRPTDPRTLAFTQGKMVY